MSKYVELPKALYDKYFSPYCRLQECPARSAIAFRAGDGVVGKGLF